MYLRLKSCLLAGLVALLSFAPGAAALADQTLFTTQTPVDLSVTDGPGVDYELGMKFKSTAAGYIKGIRFYKSASESGTHVGHVFSSTGTVLATVTFTGETASGWQQQLLSTPLAIAANTTYVVSVNTGNSYYVDTVSGLASQVVNGNLKSVVGSNGVFGPVGQLPTSSWNNSNYFRDVVFGTSLSDTVPPTVSLTSPTNNQFVAPGTAVTLQATASDNVGVSKVEFYVDGTLTCTDTSSPYSCSYTTASAGNVANAVQAKAYDAANNSANSSANTMLVSAPTATWQNVSFTAQNAGFTAEFDARPSASTEDVVVGLSQNAAAAYTDLAAIVRFGNSGVMDVRNGAAYAADNVVNNVAGTSYHFRMLVDVATKKYTVYVTPEGQNEVLLAYNYSFRDSQSTVTSLANRGKYGEVGDVFISNFTVTPVTPPPADTTPPSVSLTAPANGGTVSGTISVTADASDNVGVAGVQFKLDGVNLGAEDTASPYSVSWNTTTAANGSHTLTAVARDAAGNTATATTVNVTVNNTAVKPTAANTGWQPTGVTLTPSGSLNITTNGTVIDSLDISGSVIINASNVTIKRSRVRSSFYYPIWVQGGTNVTIQDVEVDGLGGPADGGQKCIYAPSGGALIQRNNLHDCEDGMSLGGALTAQYNYIHNPNGPASQHSDGMEYYGGSGATIAYNNFDYVNATTSAANFTNDFGAISSIVFDHNWLAGGAYNLYVDGSHSGGSISGVQVTNNRFVRNSATYGTDLVRNASGITWTGNVYDDNDESIPNP